MIAAVTVSGPTFRIGEDNLLEIAGHVVAAAEEIPSATGIPRRG